MKLYEIVDNKDTTAVYTEAEIIEEYWQYWYTKMVAQFGKDHTGITTDNCIQDWIVVNLAVDVSIPI